MTNNEGNPTKKIAYGLTIRFGDELNELLDDLRSKRQNLPASRRLTEEEKAQSKTNLGSTAETDRVMEFMNRTLEVFNHFCPDQVLGLLTTDREKGLKPEMFYTPPTAEHPAGVVTSSTTETIAFGIPDYKIKQIFANVIFNLLANDDQVGIFIIKELDEVEPMASSPSPNDKVE